MDRKTIRRVSLWGLAIITGLMWTAASATMSWADIGGYGHHQRPDASKFIWHVRRAKEALNLSQEQQARLQTIAMNYKREKVMKMAEVKLAEIDMHQLLHNPAASPNSTDVEAAVRKVHTLKADRQMASIKAFQEARTVLTPEQQQKLRQLREQRHAAEQRHGDGANSHSDAR
jgi:Spy/CpxP family protein refolding chaperone